MDECGKGNRNPLSVTTPENLSAKEAFSLFVPVFGDYPKILREGHTFLQGPRGCGKSMIFRYLQPDCQRLVNHCGLSELPFYSLYVPLRNTEVKLTELLRLEGHHSSVVLNEHLISMFIATNVFKQLERDTSDVHDESSMSAVRDYAHRFFELFRQCGWKSEEPDFKQVYEPSMCFNKIAGICQDSTRGVIQYVRRLFIPNELPTYGGPLCGYLDFLFPLLCDLRRLPFAPRGPVYLLIDDADNLNLTQTKVLNTWVATRTSGEVSLKISNQLAYKTYMTTRGNTIDTPHDYSEVNISPVYTGSTKGRYKDRVGAIVKKRFEHYGIVAEPWEFFPEDKEQEDAIKKTAEQLRKRWPEEGRGYRPGDDAARYARPDYMKKLVGKSKSGPSYSYAGFEQLVHISSGVVRYFLEPAALMYSEASAKNPNIQVTSIPADVQNQVIRDQADNFLFLEMEKMLQDQSEEAPPKDDLIKLRNLIQALGGTFKQILLSDRSERRVFSIAFSNEPDDEILRVLRLGIRLSYFHVSAIGNKDGTGRTPLYILNRRLAPHFYLDPTSFAGYLFVTREAIREAISNPTALLRKVSENIDGVFETRQLTFSEVVVGDNWP